ncbi:MAG: hypothetical protein IPJ93_00005 [Bacteroidota bacterium]|nr:MAG: hypothetical protein IPJ93_00005 [Bacteroidota bacterium]
MNENVWFLVENKLSDGKEQITGQFSTNTWNGRFFIDAQGYIFIPFNGCRNEKNDRMIKNGNSFLSHFHLAKQVRIMIVCRFMKTSLKNKTDYRNSINQKHN